ncbi:transmembrane protein 234 homolog [Asparagus officinalis]|uniref:transmembrane protein 234 homolog n=1 Tax=Asparagus officinalis TaxID=4686 RepID=UPI00098E64C5|nr:transmembrane protein 234 homolog [Asparagus officinalis]
MLKWYLGTVGQLRKWADLISIYHYSVPFIVNLCASAGFFYMLGDAPVSVAVPVTNATTFAATALSGMVLGEETRVGLVMIGTAIIVLGVWICVM